MKIILYPFRSRQHYPRKNRIAHRCQDAFVACLLLPDIISHVWAEIVHLRNRKGRPRGRLFLSYGLCMGEEIGFRLPAPKTVMRLADLCQPPEHGVGFPQLSKIRNGCHGHGDRVVFQLLAPREFPAGAGWYPPPNPARPHG